MSKMMEDYLAWTKSENSAKVVEFNDGFFDENLLKINEWKGLGLEVAEV